MMRATAYDKEQESMREPDVEKLLLGALDRISVGGHVSLDLKLSSPMDVAMVFDNGWEIGFIVHPGEQLQLTKGEHGLVRMTMTIRPPGVN